MHKNHPLLLMHRVAEVNGSLFDVSVMCVCVCGLQISVYERGTECACACAGMIGVYCCI